MRYITTLTALWTLLGLFQFVHLACQTVGVDDWNKGIQPMNFTFGLKDSTNGSVSLQTRLSRSNLKLI